MASVEVHTVSIFLACFLSYLALSGASNYAGREKASESVVVLGKVFCDPCLEHRLSENGYVISGASIAVECGLNRKTMALSIIAETNENGEFKVELPSTIFQSADKLNKCQVRPRNSAYDSSCRIPLKPATSKLKLQSDSNGVLTYSAGSFSYRHETVPSSCYRKYFFRAMKGRAMSGNVDQSSKPGQRTPTIPSLPKFPPTIPPLPSFGIPPLPTIPLPKITPQPNFGFPPLPTFPPLHSIPPLPSISPLHSIPPLPSISPLPTFPPLPSIAPLPSIPPLPTFPPLPSIAPLPSIPPLPTSPLPSIPPLPTFPPLPTIPLPPTITLPPLPTIPLPPAIPLPPLPSFPPLPKIPPLPPCFPPFPEVPPFPQIPNIPFPPNPFLIPRPPSD